MVLPDTPHARRTTSPLRATTQPGCSIRLLARVAYCAFDLNNNSEDRLNDVAIDAMGRVVVVGYTATGNDRDWAMMRFTAAGVPDATFGANGRSAYHDDDTGSEARSVSVQPNGSIWIGGAFNGKIAIARLDDHGIRDPAFGVNGMAEVGEAGSFGYKLLVVPDGAIALGSVSKLNNGLASIVRVNNSGALVAGFGAGGILDTDLGTGDSDIWFGGALESGNRALAVGWSKRLTGSRSI